MKTYLGVDGGGSKTRFLLVDERGSVLARHTEGPAYYLEIGLESLQAMLTRGIATTLQQGHLSAGDLTFAFFGLPSYGEDRSLRATLDRLPAEGLAQERYRCGNDVICGWSGALAGDDGISVVAGTGSIAYGECAGVSARAGGWGELFSDEGSAYWLAREGLTLFSRMSDGRTPRGPLHTLVRRHFVLADDLDLCAAVYGKSVAQRSQFAQLSKLVAEAAQFGDTQARALLARAAQELADLIDAVRRQLGVLPQRELAVSYSGGLFAEPDLLLEPLRAALASRARVYRLLGARLSPDAGAALYAAKLSGEWAESQRRRGSGVGTGTFLVWNPCSALAAIRLVVASELTTYQLVGMLLNMPIVAANAQPKIGARQKLLDAALSLIRQQGYASTSVDELCAQARVTKGAFFHHFKSKDELAVAAANHWSDVTGAFFAAASYHKHSDPLERVLGYLDLRKSILKGELSEFTCLVGTMVQEIYQTSPEIRDACDASISAHAAKLEADITEAMRRYRILAKWTAAGLALHTQAVLQGAFILAKAKNNAAVAAASIEHLRCYIELLFRTPRSQQN